MTQTESAPEPGDRDRLPAGAPHGPGHHEFDYVVVGSGFGGSVAALRLAEKGYRVLVLEKGKRLGVDDFPRTNWNLRRWLWLPALRFFGLFKMTWLRHVTVLSGVGVGGGSLVYGNTLPVPERAFFLAESWAHLADWERELEGFYLLASRMLGCAAYPRLETGDKALRTVAERNGRGERFELARVGVFFGDAEKPVQDPYFGGQGPERVGCSFCGGCMLGCRHGAKNTLDKNYLFLAEALGARIRPESEVTDVRPLGRADGSDGYRVTWRASASPSGSKGTVTCRGVVFSGGVLGTVDLLLRLRRSSLPMLSRTVGSRVRTNSESLIGVTTLDPSTTLSDGVAISSILQFDDHSHVEPVRFPPGSGIYRLATLPLAHGRNAVVRLLRIAADLITHPIDWLKVLFVADWARRTQILLFMQTLDSTLRLSRGLFGLRTSPEGGGSPTAFIPEAKAVAEQFAGVVNGKPVVLLTETLFGIPTTAHILGGCVMGVDPTEGVIDKDNKVFGYAHMYVCDGSMISANLGVNPALTITALSERAMSRVPSA